MQLCTNTNALWLEAPKTVIIRKASFVYLATISIEMERFLTEKNKENVYDKEIDIFVQNDRHKDVVNTK